MTKKHFQLLAEHLGIKLRDARRLNTPGFVAGVEATIGSVASACAEANPRFDRERFWKAIDKVVEEGLT